MKEPTVTIAESYMRDIFDTLGDAIRQRNQLDFLITKCHTQEQEMEELRQRLLAREAELGALRGLLGATQKQLEVAQQENKLETIYARIFLENISKKDEPLRAESVETVMNTLKKRKRDCKA